MTYLYAENKGFGITTSSQSIARYEPPDIRAGLPGTGLMALGRQSSTRVNYLKDANGNPAPFYIDVPRMLTVSGRITFKHAEISAPGYGIDYAIYANARLHLEGPYANDIDMPDLDWTSPGGTEVMLDGGNIRDPQEHYATRNLAYQQMLQPGYYRLSLWAGCGSDAYDVDGLGIMYWYAADKIHQIFVRVD